MICKDEINIANFCEKVKVLTLFKKSFAKTFSRNFRYLRFVSLSTFSSAPDRCFS